MTDAQTIMALTLGCCVLGVLLLHSLWRRYALGSLARTLAKKLKQLQL